MFFSIMAFDGMKCLLIFYRYGILPVKVITRYLDEI